MQSSDDCVAHVRSRKLVVLQLFFSMITYQETQYWDYNWDANSPRCKQKLKNETKQIGLKSEYLLSQARSGALLGFTAGAGMEPTQWLPQIVHIIVRRCRLKKEKITKRNEKFFETRMVSDLSSSAVVKTQIPRVSCPPKSTLKSLIEEQTEINEQGWKKMPPCLLI